MSNAELMDQLYKHTVEAQTEKLLAENRRLTGINQNGKATILVVGDELVEAVANAATQKLYNYEDSEEKGMSVRLPCKVGDTVWVRMQNGGLAEAEVVDYTHFLTCGFCLVLVSKKFCKQNIPFSEVGKTVFLTREAAEKGT